MNKPIMFTLALLVVLLPLGSSNMNNANAIASEDEYYIEQYDARYGMDMANEYEDRNSYQYDDYYSQDQDRYYSYNDDYKSKENKDNIVSISKTSCNNVNIAGNMSGNINVGNSGKAGQGAETSESALNAKSFENGERYYNGDQEDLDFNCIINNNNNNTEPAQEGTTGTLGTVRIEPGNSFSEVDSGTSTATCDPDEQVIGGIYDYSGSSLVRADETIDTPSNSYSVEFTDQVGFETDFQAFAVCISKQIN